MSHFDTITRAPDGFSVVASTPNTPAAAFEDLDRRICGVQFHPEVKHTPRGQDILQHFLYDVAGCAPEWTPASVIEEQVAAHPRAGRRQEGAVRACPAASTRLSPRRSSTRPSATS